MPVNCYECEHRGSVPGSVHSCCNYPGNDTSLLGLLSDANLKNARKLKIQADPHGVRNGWFMWPIDFDPVWLKNCEGFTPKKDNNTNPAQ